MKSIFDKLNLRPQERRLVVIVSIVVFAVANFWFVIPHFGDLGRNQQRKLDAQKTLLKYKDELGKKTRYERELKQLESVGAYLPSEEQALELQREVYQQANQSGVIIQRSDASRIGSQQRTNSFFEEQTLVVVVTTGEKELVEFLYGLGKGQSLTRVSSMSLQRDPTQTKLTGNITLVKSFQKKPPRAAPSTMVAAATTTGAKSTGSVARPAGAPPSKPTTVAAKASPGPTNVAGANTNQLRRPIPIPPPKK